MIIPSDYDEFKKYGLRAITDTQSDNKSSNTNNGIVPLNEEQLNKAKEQSNNILNGFNPLQGGYK